MLYVQVLGNVASQPDVLQPQEPHHPGGLGDGPGGAGIADPQVAGDVLGEELLAGLPRAGHHVVGDVVLVVLRITHYWLPPHHHTHQKPVWIIFVCEADLEILMLSIVCRNIEMSDQVTK